MAKPPKKTSLGFNAQVTKRVPPNSYDYEHDNRSALVVFMFQDIRKIPHHDPWHDIYFNGGHVLYFHDFENYADRIWLANADTFKVASQYRLGGATSPLRYMKVSGYSVKTLPEVTEDEWDQLNKPQFRTDFKLNKIDYEDVISLVKLVDAGPLPNFTYPQPRYVH